MKKTNKKPTLEEMMLGLDPNKYGKITGKRLKLERTKNPWDGIEAVPVDEIEIDGVIDTGNPFRRTYGEER